MKGAEENKVGIETAFVGLELHARLGLNAYITGSGPTPLRRQLDDLSSMSP